MNGFIPSGRCELCPADIPHERIWLLLALSMPNRQPTMKTSNEALLRNGAILEDIMEPFLRLKEICAFVSNSTGLSCDVVKSFVSMLCLS